MNYQAAIFDLDGTLLNTLEDIADAANEVLEKRNLPIHPIDAYRFFVGEGINVLTYRALPENHRDEETVSACAKEIREAYSWHWDQKTRPYNGITDLLDQLTGRQVRVAVLSNKPDEFTKKCVAKHFSGWNFEVVFGEHAAIPRKPDPGGALQIASRMEIPPERFVYVGDTPIDMKTGRSAGMFTIGVLWGFRSSKELVDSGAQEVIEHPLDLLRFLK